MAVLLDTRDLAPAERNDVVRDVLEFSGGRSLVGHDCPADQICGLMEYWQLGASVTMAFDISYEQFGVPVDAVRRAHGRLAASPLYDLMTGYLAQLCRSADSLPDGPARAMLGTATIELMRALISSAAGDDPRRNAALQDTLRTRVATYVQQHLTDRDLCADKIAREHHISVRHLYKLWACQELSLGRWITRERLEGARRDLTGSKNRAETVAATAHRWGFADSTHFSRKFREAYSMSPQEWRQLNR